MRKVDIIGELYRYLATVKEASLDAIEEALNGGNYGMHAPDKHQLKYALGRMVGTGYVERRYQHVGKHRHSYYSLTPSGVTRAKENLMLQMRRREQALIDVLAPLAALAEVHG